MADVLTDRASLARAFYRLTATSSTNPGLIEHDSSTLETLYQYLQYGAWDAQEYMIDSGFTDRWLTTSSALTFSGAAAPGGARGGGGRVSTLPRRRRPRGLWGLGWLWLGGGGGAGTKNPPQPPPPL